MENVTSIGHSAFYDCWNLASAINLPNVTKLDVTTFYNCGKIPSINIPLVTSIGSQSFYNVCKYI